MQDSAPIIRITAKPALRTRAFQWLVSKLAHVDEIDESNCSYHRKKLDKQAASLPQPKNFQFRREMLDGFEAEWMIPQDADKNKILYYLHGGGYAICSVTTHRRLIAAIAKKAKIQAFAIDYRLAPEHRFPAAVDDALQGYLHLLEKGFDPKNIIIAGDSAGGGLAVATLINLKSKNIQLPAAAVCISPWVDMEGTGESLIANRKTEMLLTPQAVKKWGAIYAGDQQKNPLASAIHGDLKGIPPIYIQASDTEILLDDSIRLHEKALSDSIDSTLEIRNGLLHVWQIHTFLPESKEAISHIARFINAHL